MVLGNGDEPLYQDGRINLGLASGGVTEDHPLGGSRTANDHVLCVPPESRSEVEGVER
ncbi:hypothetical protein [Streptomyces sp. NPDC048357]|uniref:hypothetical protein n=1 Tax=Streptomyces sp. NPDC048357 TaxID=3154719 RepID=UPI00341231DB